MAKGKYIKDYRIVETVNSRGGIRAETEYIGEPYVFQKGAQRAGKTRRLILFLCLLGWISFIAALFPESAGMRSLYVALPFAFSALPLFLLTDLMLTTLRVKEPMEHRTADKFDNRFPAQSLALAVLSGASLLGELIRFLTDREGMLAGDAVFSPCAAVLLACGVLAFSRRGELTTQKGNTSAY